MNSLYRSQVSTSPFIFRMNLETLLSRDVSFDIMQPQISSKVKASAIDEGKDTDVFWFPFRAFGLFCDPFLWRSAKSSCPCECKSPAPRQRLHRRPCIASGWDQVTKVLTLWMWGPCGFDLKKNMQKIAFSWGPPGSMTRTCPLKQKVVGQRQAPENRLIFFFKFSGDVWWS